MTYHISSTLPSFYDGYCAKSHHPFTPKRIDLFSVVLFETYSLSVSLSPFLIRSLRVCIRMQMFFFFFKNTFHFIRADSLRLFWHAIKQNICIIKRRKLRRLLFCMRFSFCLISLVLLVVIRKLRIIIAQWNLHAFFFFFVCFCKLFFIMITIYNLRCPHWCIAYHNHCK